MYSIDLESHVFEKLGIDTKKLLFSIEGHEKCYQLERKMKIGKDRPLGLVPLLVLLEVLLLRLERLEAVLDVRNERLDLRLLRL